MIKRGEDKTKRNSSFILYVILIIGTIILISYIQNINTGHVTIGSSGNSGEPEIGGDETEGDWNSGTDCHTGESQGDPESSCKKSYDGACLIAKAKAIAEKGPGCTKKCTDEYYTGGSLICDCPLTGNNPVTGQPYTCVERTSTGNCVASTVAVCECKCDEKEVK